MNVSMTIKKKLVVFLRGVSVFAQKIKNEFVHLNFLSSLHKRDKFR